LGLVDLLSQCEIIQSDQTTATQKTAIESVGAANLGDFESLTTAKEAAAPHRALIFCQMSSFVELVVTQVLERLNIKHIYLKSAHSPKERIQLVETFN